MQNNKREKRSIKDLIILTFVGLVVKLYPLNQSLWLDEATSIVKVTTLSVKELLFTFAPGDFHPPLYYLILKVWISVFGSSEIAARSLSLLCGLLSAILLYLIANKLFNRFVAFASGLLLSTSPLFFYYSQEARMYTMSTFFSLLAVWTFIQIVFASKVKLIHWMSFVTTSVVLLYTDYLPGVMLLFCVAFLLLEKKSIKAHKTGWILSFIAILVLLIPWIPIFLQQLGVGVAVRENAPIWWETLGKTNFKQIALVPVKFLIGRITFSNKLIYALVVIFYSFEFGVSFFASLKKFQAAKFVWLWLSLPFVLALVLGLVMSGFSYFRLLFLLPPFYLLVAHGLSLTKSNWGKLYFRVALSVLAILFFTFSPNLWREDWKDAVLWIEQDAGDKSAAAIFVTKNQRDPYYYYSRNRVPSYGSDGLEAGNFENIYLMRYVQPIFDPQDTLRKKIEASEYRKMQERDFNGVTVWKYERSVYANRY